MHKNHTFAGYESGLQSIRKQGIFYVTRLHFGCSSVPGVYSEGMLKAVLPASFVLPTYLKGEERGDRDYILNTLSIGTVLALVGRVVVRLVYQGSSSGIHFSCYFAFQLQNNRKETVETTIIDTQPDWRRS
jgi:hypothetical protein